MKPGRPLAVLFALTMITSTACGDDGDADDDDDDDDDDDVVEIDGGGDVDASADVDGPVAEDLDMQADDFECIKNGTKVNKFFLWNSLGHLDEALEVANSEQGGVYPVGTVVQLIPDEAMVKRANGWNPTTNDWEFFALTNNGDVTTIAARGVEDVVNSFGGNCFDCHVKAEPQWDLICETTHGCDPLGIPDEFITDLQDADMRCNN